MRLVFRVAPEPSRTTRRPTRADQHTTNFRPPRCNLLRMPMTQASPRWYQGVDRYCWVVLIVAALGWMFDTMDQNLFTLVRNNSIADLLGPVRGTDAAYVKFIGSWVTAAFLVGWSVGGFVF